MREYQILQLQDDLSRAIIETGWVAENFSSFSVNGVSNLAFIYGGSEWINVFIRNQKPSDSYGEFTGKFNDYGLHKSGESWSYGRAPPGVIMIKSLLRYNQLI